MYNFSSHPEQGSEKGPQRGKHALQWWYHMTSPSEPASSASFAERERFRRGRTGSLVLMILFLLLFLSYPAAFAGSNSFLITILTIDILLLTLAAGLNRWGYVNASGILVVCCFIASPTINILTTPKGLNTAVLPIYGLLVLPLMCAVSFLPPWWVFIIGIGNCLFTLYTLIFLPSTGELHTLLQIAFPGIITPILLSQMIVSLVAFLWVQGATDALQRADRAEEIAHLEAIELQHQEEQLALSRQIEEGIQQILSTMGSILSHNDFSIHIPLKQENILWRVSILINTLLARLQDLKQQQEELEKTYFVAQDVARHIKERRSIELEAWTKTALDPVILEYNLWLRNL